MKAKIFVVAVVMFTFGCSLGAHLAGNMAADIIDSAFKPKPPKKILIDKEVEKFQIGTHDVRFYDGAYYDTPSVLLIAKPISTPEKKPEEGKLLAFEKTSYAAMKLLRDFDKLSGPERVVQIRNWYIRFHDYDLGSDPDPAAEPPASSESQPTPAPTPEPPPTTS